MRGTDVLVIGAGLSGLTAAWQAASHGRRVRVIAKGWGATHWHSGCIDVLGYHPVESQAAVESPAAGVAQLIQENPHHPYALVGLDALDQALHAFQELCAAAGYPMHGLLERNWLLPSAVGAIRPTCLAPETMIAGDLRSTLVRRRDPMLIVGFRPFQDFHAALIADNLSAQGILARDVTLDLPTAQQRRSVNTMNLARLLEAADFRAAVAGALRPHLGDAVRVGFPAVLGVQNALAVQRELQERLGCEVFEIPILPPSVPGMRLHQVLVTAIEQAGGRVFEGMEALAAPLRKQGTTADTQDGRVTTVWSEAAARRIPHRAAAFVLATGGILGGGIVADCDGSLREVVFGLPVTAPAERGEWFRPEFLDPRGHPIYRAGVEVNAHLQPLDAARHVVYENLLAVGATLAGCDTLRERSYEGAALATGYMAGELV